MFERFYVTAFVRMGDAQTDSEEAVFTCTSALDMPRLTVLSFFFPMD